MTVSPNFVAGGSEGALLNQVTQECSGFTLHVSNIPVNMDADGLRNQFCPPGTTVQPREVKIIPPKLPGARTVYGYVTYDTYDEAREASGRLNGVPPFRLRVYPKKTDAERLAQHEEDLAREREAKATIDKLDQYQRGENTGHSENVPQLSGRTASIQAAAVGRSGDKQVGSVKSGGTYPDRHQAGYTSASDVEKVDTNSNLVNAGFPSHAASSAVFRHGNPIAVRIRTPVLDCLDCGNEGRVRCSRCKSWYCSQRCQANHWPAHRPDCVPPPPLENPDGTTYIQPSMRLLRQEQPGAPLRQPTESAFRPVSASSNSFVPISTQTSSKKYITKPEVSKETPKPAVNTTQNTQQPPAKTVTPVKETQKEVAKEMPKPTPVNTTQTTQPPAKTVTPAKEMPKLTPVNTTQTTQQPPAKTETPKQVAKEMPKPTPVNTTQTPQQPPAKTVTPAKETPKQVAKEIPKPTPVNTTMTMQQPTAKPLTPAKETPKTAPAPASQEKSPKAEVPDRIEKIDLEKWAVFNQTNLDEIKAGDVLMMTVNFDRKVTDATTSIVNTPASFAAFCVHGDIENPDSDVNYLLTELDPVYAECNESGKLGVVASTPGQVVLVSEEDEGNVSRCIMVQKESESVGSVYGIDIPGMRKRAFADMMVAPERAKKICGHGYRLTCAEPLTPAMTSQVKALAEDGILNFQVTDVKKFGAAAGQARLKKLKVVMLDLDENPLVEYSAVPWYRVGDPRVQTLLGVPSEQTFLNEYRSTKLKKGDAVLKIGFGEWADQLIVVRQCDKPKIQQVDDILTTTILEQLPLSKIPQVRQMVAVRTEVVKESPAYHRAVIRAVNEGEGKAKVRLLDHGATLIESLSNLFEIPDKALDKEKYPAFACLLPIHGVEGAVKMSEGPNQVMMKTLDPVFESAMTVSDIREENRHVLTHPNGKTIGQIITQKIAEPTKDRSRGEIQGMEAGGTFNFEKCTTAELRVDPSATQEVLVLSVAGPQEVYVTPCDQLDAVGTVMEQVRNYAVAAEKSFRGFRPIAGRMCVAQSKDDKQWYRAACLDEAEDGNTFTLMFADFGIFEEVPVTNILPVDPALMKAPLLANQCVIEGFEGDDAEEDEETTASIKELLPANEMAEVIVLKKNENGIYVILPAALSEDGGAPPSTPAAAPAKTPAAVPATPPAPPQTVVAPTPPAHVVPATPPTQAAAPPVTAAIPPALPSPANAAAMIAIQEQMMALQRQLAAMQSPQ